MNTVNFTNMCKVYGYMSIDICFYMTGWTDVADSNDYTVPVETGATNTANGFTATTDESSGTTGTTGCLICWQTCVNVTILM